MTLWARYNQAIHATMTRDQVRRYDQWAIGELGIPGAVLMENAGQAAAEIAAEILSRQAVRRVCICCGAGNNGGDGFVVARHLTNRQFNVQILLCAPQEKIDGDARIHLEICRQMNIPIHTLDFNESNICPQIRSFCTDCGLIIDALFGTGLKGELDSRYAGLIACINSLAIPILAVDIPSGLDCDLGIPLPVCVKAAATVSFVAAKQGFFQSEQTLQTIGTLYIASIGITTKKARI